MAVNGERLRTNVVGVTGTVFVPLSIPRKIEEHFDVILAKATDIPDPFEQSFFMMVHLAYLQPFADMNKRTSRFAANIPLIKQNLRPLPFVGIQPDATRLRFREQLVEVVHDFVVNGDAPVRRELSRWIEQHAIPAAFHDAFIETALGLLLALHEGATYRYRIRPSEFRSWKLKITRTIAN